MSIPHPCPFCGNKPSMRRNTAFPEQTVVECKQCASHLMHASMESDQFAIRQWNTLVAKGKLQLELEEERRLRTNVEHTLNLRSREIDELENTIADMKTRIEQTSAANESLHQTIESLRYNLAKKREECNKFRAESIEATALNKQQFQTIMQQDSFITNNNRRILDLVLERDELTEANRTQTLALLNIRQSMGIDIEDIQNRIAEKKQKLIGNIEYILEQAREL